MDPERRYYFPVTGYNFRLTNIAAAILCGQLERSDDMLGRRRRIFTLYRDLLEDIPGIGFQPVAPWAEPAPWLFCVTVDSDEFGMTRDQLMQVLAQRGIETRPFFIPLHTLPPFREGARYRGEFLPVTDHLGQAGLNLPTFPALTDAQTHRICAEIASARRSTAPRSLPSDRSR
jgi:perosamine synthetase